MLLLHILICYGRTSVCQHNQMYLPLTSKLMNNEEVGFVVLQCAPVGESMWIYLATIKCFVTLLSKVLHIHMHSLC